MHIQNKTIDERERHEKFTTQSKVNHFAKYT